MVQPTKRSSCRGFRKQPNLLISETGIATASLKWGWRFIPLSSAPPSAKVRTVQPPPAPSLPSGGKPPFRTHKPPTNNSVRVQLGDLHPLSCMPRATRLRARRRLVRRHRPCMAGQGDPCRAKPPRGRLFACRSSGLLRPKPLPGFRAHRAVMSPQRQEWARQVHERNIWREGAGRPLLSAGGGPTVVVLWPSEGARRRVIKCHEGRFFSIIPRDGPPSPLRSIHKDKPWSANTPFWRGTVDCCSPECRPPPRDTRSLSIAVVA